MELTIWKDWLPLAGVAVGWGLNQCGQWLVFRRDERRAGRCPGALEGGSGCASSLQ